MISLSYQLYLQRSLSSLRNHRPRRLCLFLVASLLTSSSHSPHSFATATNPSSISTSTARGSPLAFLTFGNHIQHQKSIINRRMQHSTNMAKLDSPSAQRNKEPIWEVLSNQVISKLLKSKDDNALQILEIAAGCGVHTEFFALQLLKEQKTSFAWYPTDPSPQSRASIQAYINDDNKLKDCVKSPQSITLLSSGIEETEVSSGLSNLDLMICINMIHISPWDATVGLMKVAGSKLEQNGILYLYGPYIVGGSAVQSNLNFDQSLKSRDPQWGVRNLEDVIDLAKENGLEFVEKVEMPANNLSVIFRKN